MQPSDWSEHFFGIIDVDFLYPLLLLYTAHTSSTLSSLPLSHPTLPHDSESPPP